jgi:DNA-directed RNA polymerase alpha subunit
MSDNEKGTDPGLSAAKRRELRGHEAQEAIAHHEKTQKEFHENRKRLREERLTREAAAGPMLFPAPELPDNTPIDHVRFGSRIRNALNAAGMKSIGEVRETSADALLSLPGLGSGSVAHLREALGLSSTDGVRPKCKSHDPVPLIAVAQARLSDLI